MSKSRIGRRRRAWIDTRRLLVTLLLCSWFAGLNASQDGDGRPNILLIVADDLGYADLGVHGSDIRTPNIDALAEEGVLFTNFHTAPMCAPTRAMLLSGNNNHVAGMARQHPSGLVEAYLPGYEGHLSDRIVPFPRLLRDAGYHTYTTGKWHLGMEEQHSPSAAGFERSFNLLDGAGNHWDATGFENGISTYRADGRLTTYPDGHYSTAFYTDRLIEFIDHHKGDGRPFFAFAAYTSPHWPLQVPEPELERYRGVYDDGYEALRIKNFESLKSRGVVPADSVLPPRNEAVTPWEQLDAEERKAESRKMELYASMVENLDGHIGRLIGYLKASGLNENTLIVFMSDNGAAAEDFYNQEPYRDYVRAHYDNTYENMGRSDSWVSYGLPWAEAGSAPFKRHKGSAFEGGIRAPLVIAGAGVRAQSAFNSDYLTLMDLAPTFLELANAAYPADGSVAPMLGTSLNALLAGEPVTVHGEDYVTVLSHRGRTFVRRGKWKIVADPQPFDEANFELFDIEADPGEINDLSDSFPEIKRELIALWQERRRTLGIVLPSDL
jgi:arylsulfatase